MKTNIYILSYVTQFFVE